MCFYDNLYIKHLKKAYKRNIRVIFVSIIPYSQYILIYYRDKSAKRGGAHKNLISITFTAHHPISIQIQNLNHLNRLIIVNLFC